MLRTYTINVTVRNRDDSRGCYYCKKTFYIVSAHEILLTSTMVHKRNVLKYYKCEKCFIECGDNEFVIRFTKVQRINSQSK